MAVRERNGHWQVDLTLNGNRIRQTLETEAEAQAYELVAQAAAMLGQPIPKPSRVNPVGRPSKKDTIKAHLETVHRRRWAKQKTSSEALRDCMLFANFVGPLLPVAGALTQEHIDDYVEFMLDKGLTGRTINRRLSPVSVLVKAALTDRAIPHMLYIPHHKNAPGRTRFYDPKELTELFTVADTLDLEYADLFRFLAATGCRLGEALRLAWSDITGNIATLRDTKNGTDRNIALTTAMQTMLGRKRNSKGGPFHGLSRRRLYTVWDQMRGRIKWMDKETVVHTFRHTNASVLFQDGANPAHVGRWLGHKSSQSTDRYTHLRTENLEALAGLLDGRAGGT